MSKCEELEEIFSQLREVHNLGWTDSVKEEARERIILYLAVLAGHLCEGECPGRNNAIPALLSSAGSLAKSNGFSTDRWIKELTLMTNIYDPNIIELLAVAKDQAPVNIPSNPDAN